MLFLDELFQSKHRLVCERGQRDFGADFQHRQTVQIHREHIKQGAVVTRNRQQIKILRQQVRNSLIHAIHSFNRPRRSLLKSFHQPQAHKRRVQSETQAEVQFHFTCGNLQFQCQMTDEWRSDVKLEHDTECRWSNFNFQSGGNPNKKRFEGGVGARISFLQLDPSVFYARNVFLFLWHDFSCLAVI